MSKLIRPDGFILSSYSEYARGIHYLALCLQLHTKKAKFVLQVMADWTSHMVGKRPMKQQRGINNGSNRLGGRVNALCDLTKQPVLTVFSRFSRSK